MALTFRKGYENLDIDKKDFLGDLDIMKMADGDELQSHRKFKRCENTS